MVAAHSLELADVDGDGRDDVIVAAGQGPLQVFYTR
jgi:hypothetical protein